MTPDLEQRIADKAKHFQDINAHFHYLQNLRDVVKSELNAVTGRMNSADERRKAIGKELSELREQTRAGEQKPYIKKQDLIHLAVYRGECRNASVAIWNAEHNEFNYVRSKFGSPRGEEIPHIDDAKDGEDGFIPEEIMHP